MTLETISSSNIFTSDSTYQFATRVAPDPEERTLMISFINFLQKHHLDETQAALLRELSLTDNSEVTLDELQEAINMRDTKLLREPRFLSVGQLSPLPMETDEAYRKLQSVHLQAIDKPLTPGYTDLSIGSAIENGSPSPPLLIKDDFRMKSAYPNDGASILVPNSSPSGSVGATAPGAASYQLPIILNSLQGTSQASSMYTLLQPSQRQTQILVDVGSNSLAQLQQFGTKSLNGVIPIQLNLSASQHLQQQQQPQAPATPPQQQKQQQQQQQQQQQHQQQHQQQIHIQLPPQQMKQAHTQVVYNSQQLQLLNATAKQSAQTQPQQMILTPLTNDNQIPATNCSPIVFSKVIEPSIAASSPASVTLQIHQPGVAQPKIDPHLLQKEGAHITLDTNNRPVISYSQVTTALPQAPKALLTPNGICQMENLHMSSGEIQAIPIANLSPHFSFDPAFELGQRRRKKRAVFAPQVRRALEVAFEQNSRPSRRELEFLAGKLGLLFEEVRVWFCNKRQKERQQLQLSANDPSQSDSCGDSYNAFYDSSPPLQAVTPQQAFEEALHDPEYRVKDEFDSDIMLLPVCVSDTNQPERKDLMPDSEYINTSLGLSYTTVAKNSIA